MEFLFSAAYAAIMILFVLLLAVWWLFWASNRFGHVTIETRFFTIAVLSPSFQRHIEQLSATQKNQGTSHLTSKIGSVPNNIVEPQPNLTDEESRKVRRELADNLVKRVDQIISSIGDISLATHLAFLKRDLSRCYDVLKNRPLESHFLSIVTFVELGIAQIKWKDYSQIQWETIRRAFEMGSQNNPIFLEDYQKARALLLSQQIDVIPKIDLESLSWEDIENE